MVTFGRKGVVHYHVVLTANEENAYVFLRQRVPHLNVFFWPNLSRRLRLMCTK